MSLFESLPEDFLHFAWKSLSFDLGELRTSGGDSVQIISVGTHNQDQGPDFLNAHLIIGGLHWHGQVEIHLTSRDWYHHQHQSDPAYNAVILHLVLEGGTGKKILRQDGTAIPELILGARIFSHTLARYDSLRLNPAPIPCTELVHQVSPQHRREWVEQLAAARIRLKTTKLSQHLRSTTEDWDQVLWECLASYLAGPVNQAAFQLLSQRIPYQVIRTYVNQPFQLEALLFGGSGALSVGKGGDEYPFSLAKEWQYLNRKHAFPPWTPVPLKHSKMRPAAFPTLRMAQLASILHIFQPLSQLLSPGGIQAFMAREIRASSFWDTHYRFGEAHAPKPKCLGQQHKTSVIINVLLPLLMLYEEKRGHNNPWESCREALRQLKAENNRHTRPLTGLDFPNEHALHSQGLIQLYREYCLQHRCLNCAIGQNILGKE